MNNWLAHEANNFLNNLLLQLAISEKSFPESVRGDWRSIRREGRKLADLLQQWQRQRRPAADEAGTIDVNKVVQEIAQALRPEAGVTLVFKPAPQALWVAGFTGDVQRLCVLLLQYALEGSAAAVVEARLERSEEEMILRVLDAQSPDANLRWSDFEDAAPTERNTLSLPVLACKSLAERLGGRIGTEKDGQDRLSLVLSLPLAF